jgi:triosephosphate isomerase
MKKFEMKKIVVANWKMNGNTEFLNNYFHEEANISDMVDIVICPQFPLLLSLYDYAKKYNFFIGAQDCHYAEKGAYTGDVSANLLADIGVEYVIIGHSERRAYHLEENEHIAKKFQAAQELALIPILCIGEVLEDRKNGNYKNFILEQLENSLPENFTENFVIAYEPVWSIGTGMIPDNKQISEICELVREFLKNKMGDNYQKVRILYGGSVNEKNVTDIKKIQGLSGYLVGSASLERGKFIEIANSLT